MRTALIALLLSAALVFAGEETAKKPEPKEEAVKNSDGIECVKVKCSACDPNGLTREEIYGAKPGQKIATEYCGQCSGLGYMLLNPKGYRESAPVSPELKKLFAVRFVFRNAERKVKYLECELEKAKKELATAEAAFKEAEGKMTKAATEKAKTPEPN